MEFKQLEAFICVMECGSFSKAAERLYLSQPTVSTHIATLERELGVRLFMRTTKEVYPSREGQLLYDYARRIQVLQTEAKEKLTGVSGFAGGTVTVATSTIPMQMLLPEFLSEFREKYSNISVELQLTDSQDAVDKVGRHIADIGFCGTRIKNSRCSFKEVGEDSIVVAAPNEPRFRQYINGGFPARQIERETVIARERGSGTRREAEQFLKGMGVNCACLNIAEERGSNSDVLDGVRSGAGIALLSRRFLDEQEQHGFICLDFSGAKLRRKLYMVRHKKIELSLAAGAFYDFVLSFVQKK